MRIKVIDISEEQRKQIQKSELLILDELDRICKKYDIRYMITYGTLIGAVRHNGYIPWDDDLDLCMLRDDYIRFREACKTELDSKFFYQTNETDPEYYYLFDKIRLNETVFKESFVSKYSINHGVYIDIFPIDYIPDEMWRRNIQYIKLHFFRTGVMSKYLMLGARSGIKRLIFSLLRIPYALFPLKYLYRKAQQTAMQYDGQPHKFATSFYSPYHSRDTFDAELYSDLVQHQFEDRLTWIPKRYDEFLSKIYGNYMKLPPEKERNTNHTLTELKL